MQRAQKRLSQQSQTITLQLPKDLEKEIKEFFSLADPENRGSISRVETRNIMGNFGSNQLNALEIENELKAFDKEFESEYKQQYTVKNVLQVLQRRWNQMNGK
jgi:Ca2+-binding EF-hand superfamily protein